MKNKLSYLLIVVPAAALLWIIVESIFNILSNSYFEVWGAILGYKLLFNICLMLVAGFISLFWYLFLIRKPRTGVLVKERIISDLHSNIADSKPISGFIHSTSNAETKFHTYNGITFKYEPLTGVVYHYPHCPDDKIPLISFNEIIKKISGNFSTGTIYQRYRCDVCGFILSMSDPEIKKNWQVFADLLSAFNSGHISSLPTKSKS